MKWQHKLVKNDGNMCDQNCVTSKGARSNIKSSHKDGRMTVIDLITASGDTAMAIFIFATEQLTFRGK